MFFLEFFFMHLERHFVLKMHNTIYFTRKLKKRVSPVNQGSLLFP